MNREHVCQHTPIMMNTLRASRCTCVHTNSLDRSFLLAHKITYLGVLCIVTYPTERIPPQKDRRRQMGAAKHIWEYSLLSIQSSRPSVFGARRPQRSRCGHQPENPNRRAPVLQSCRAPRHIASRALRVLPWACEVAVRGQ
jgi:hypothetical protein